MSQVVVVSDSKDLRFLIKLSAKKIADQAKAFLSCIKTVKDTLQNCV